MIIKTPFYFSSEDKAKEVLTLETLASLTSNHETLVQHPLLTFSLETQALERPYYHITTQKLRHKESREEIEVVKQVTLITEVAEFFKSQDLVYRPPMEDNDLLNTFSKLMKQGSTHQLSEEYAGCMRPLSFLKSFNLKPPQCDMFDVKLRELESRKAGLSVSFEDPEVPQSYTQEVPEHIRQSKLFQTLTNFYSKRPVFLKNVLLNQLKVNGQSCTIHRLKSTLAYIAYYYRDGPWKNSYIRFGYNPQLHHQSVIYQVVIIKIKSKQIEDFEKNEKVEDIYDPTFTNHHNSKHLSSYQLCDLNEDIKEMVRDNLARGKGECNRVTGWLGKEQSRRIFRSLKSRIS